MTKEEIAALCERVGFPRPHFDHKRRVATVRIPMTARRTHKDRTVRLGPLPTLTQAAFDRWCGNVGHAATARFVNFNLGTGYTGNDILKMRRRKDYPIPSRIRALVRDFDQPFDPKT